MNIELTSRAREIVQRHLATGEFASPEAMVEQALDLLDAPEPTLQSLQARIQEGLADLEAGRVGLLDVEDIKHRGRERLRAELEKHS